MGQITDTNNPYTYTGRELDDTDIYYYRARYYDPTTQRFLSQDPIGFASGDFNFYRYVGNSPANFRDPFGLKYISGAFIFYKGSYSCRDCAYAPFLLAPAAVCLIGPELMVAASLNPEAVLLGETVADIIYGGLSPEPPTTPTQVIGAGINSAISSIYGH